MVFSNDEKMVEVDVKCLEVRYGYVCDLQENVFYVEWEDFGQYRYSQMKFCINGFYVKKQVFNGEGEYQVVVNVFLEFQIFYVSNYDYVVFYSDDCF